MRGRISRGCVRPARRSRAEPLRNMATHAEKRVLPYTPDQLFDLVAGVEHYPEFLPWCLGARIRSRRDNVIVADLIIGFKGIRESFTSRVTLNEPGMRIDVAYLDGPFRYLNNLPALSQRGIRSRQGMRQGHIRKIGCLHNFTGIKIILPAFFDGMGRNDGHIQQTPDHGDFAKGGQGRICMGCPLEGIGVHLVFHLLRDLC